MAAQADSFATSLSLLFTAKFQALEEGTAEKVGHAQEWASDLATTVSGMQSQLAWLEANIAKSQDVVRIEATFATRAAAAEAKVERASEHAAQIEVAVSDLAERLQNVDQCLHDMPKADQVQQIHDSIADLREQFGEVSARGVSQAARLLCLEEAAGGIESKVADLEKDVERSQALEMAVAAASTKIASVEAAMKETVVGLGEDLRQVIQVERERLDACLTFLCGVDADAKCGNERCQELEVSFVDLKQMAQSSEQALRQLASASEGRMRQLVAAEVLQLEGCLKRKLDVEKGSSFELLLANLGMKVASVEQALPETALASEDSTRRLLADEMVQLTTALDSKLGVKQAEKFELSLATLGNQLSALESALKETALASEEGMRRLVADEEVRVAECLQMKVGVEQGQKFELSLVTFGEQISVLESALKETALASEEGMRRLVADEEVRVAACLKMKLGVEQGESLRISLDSFGQQIASVEQALQEKVSASQHELQQSMADESLRVDERLRSKFDIEQGQGFEASLASIAGNLTCLEQQFGRTASSSEERMGRLEDATGSCAKRAKNLETMIAKMATIEDCERFSVALANVVERSAASDEQSRRKAVCDENAMRRLEAAIAEMRQVGERAVAEIKDNVESLERAVAEEATGLQELRAAAQSAKLSREEVASQVLALEETVLQKTSRDDLRQLESSVAARVVEAVELCMEGHAGLEDAFDELHVRVGRVVAEVEAKASAQWLEAKVASSFASIERHQLDSNSAAADHRSAVEREFVNIWAQVASIQDSVALGASAVTTVAARIEQTSREEVASNLADIKRKHLNSCSAAAERLSLIESELAELRDRITSKEGPVTAEVSNVASEDAVVRASADATENVVADLRARVVQVESRLQSQFRSHMSCPDSAENTAAVVGSTQSVSLQQHGQVSHDEALVRQASSPGPGIIQDCIVWLPAERDARISTPSNPRAARIAARDRAATSLLRTGKRRRSRGPVADDIAD